DAVGIEIGQSALCCLQSGKLVGGDQQQFIGDARCVEVPVSVDVPRIEHDHVINVTRVIQNRSGIAQILRAFHHQFRREQNVDSVDGSDHPVPEIGIELVCMLESIEEAINGFDLQQEGHGAGQRIEIRQQNFLGSEPLELERKVDRDRGGAAG